MDLRSQVNSRCRQIPIWLVYVVGFVPMFWLFWQALSGRLGVEPIESLEHEYGLLGLQLLVATLCITPLQRLAGVNLIRFRRALGLLCFYYICAHLAVWMLLDVQSLPAALQDVMKRPYITIGMAAFVVLLPLAITSNDWCCRKMGALWRRIHKLTYLAAILGAAHYVMLVKGWQTEPIIYLGVITTLLMLRLVKKKRRATPTLSPVAR